MNKFAISLAVLALIGDSDAIQLAKKQQVSADDFDDDVDTSQKIAAVQVENQKTDSQVTVDNNQNLMSDLEMYGGNKVLAVKASKITANATKQNFDQQFESGEKELNVALKAEKMTTDKDNIKTKGTDNVDKNMDEEDKKKERQKRFNPFDGNYHNDDGTVTTVDGTPVNSNVQIETSEKVKHHQKKKHVKLDVDDIENDASNLEEVAKAKKQASKNEKLREIKGAFNEFDGLLHQKDGTVVDPTTMTEVHQKKHHQELVQKKTSKKARNEQDDEDNIAEGESRAKEVDGAKKEQVENERKEAVIKEEIRKQDEFKAEYNPFDGLRHKKDGTVTEVDGKVLNGANHGINYLQKNATKAEHKSKHHKKHHHVKHHHGHKKNKTAEAKPVAATQVKIDENKEKHKHHHNGKKHHHKNSKKEQKSKEEQKHYSNKDDKMDE